MVFDDRQAEKVGQIEREAKQVRERHLQGSRHVDGIRPAKS